MESKKNKSKSKQERTIKCWVTLSRFAW